MSFIKWVGGKSNLLPQILSRIMCIPDRNDRTYYEPFLGSGVILQNVIKLFDFKKYIVSDINPILIETHKCIKDNVDELIKYLDFFSNDTNEQDYYALRDLFNYTMSNKDYSAHTCALFIYLNHTCYRGLYRVNKEGKFNTPYGHYNKPRIYDKQQLRELSDLYNSVDIEFRCSDYLKIDFRNNNVIYLDPPYTLTFDQYSNKSFNQHRIDYTIFLLTQTRNSNYIVMSDNDLFHNDIKTYFDCDVLTIQDKINAKNPGSTRTEILGDNFKSINKNNLFNQSSQVSILPQNHPVYIEPDYLILSLTPTNIQ